MEFIQVTIQDLITGMINSRKTTRWMYKRSKRMHKRKRIMYMISRRIYKRWRSMYKRRRIL